jgi:hypothetical protein
MRDPRQPQHRGVGGLRRSADGGEPPVTTSGISLGLNGFPAFCPATPNRHAILVTLLPRPEP